MNTLQFVDLPSWLLLEIFFLCMFFDNFTDTYISFLSSFLSLLGVS